MILSCNLRGALRLRCRAFVVRPGFEHNHNIYKSPMNITESSITNRKSPKDGSNNLQVDSIGSSTYAAGIATVHEPHMKTGLCSNLYIRP